MALAHEDESGIGDKPLVRWLRGHLRMTDTIDNEHFFVRKNRLLYATADAGTDSGGIQRRDFCRG